MSRDTRLDELEAALAHAERAISDLSEVATAQARDLEALRQENRVLRLRLERLETSGGYGDDDNAFVP
jgi:uncharacterized coiled-coil protein SlyX